MQSLRGWLREVYLNWEADAGRKRFPGGRPGRLMRCGECGGVFDVCVLPTEECWRFGCPPP